MSDRPTAPELVEAVTEFLAGEVLPTVDDPRLRFRTLVALNALGIAYRELVEEPVPELDTAALAARLRAGDVREDDLALLKEHVAAKLRISNPGYLERYS
ncbi:MAG TPA: DUF6285 domain-containing protein [Gaiellaceae bacterium]|nr:DUF6285 domain-containing protein [Gaiellaceae bacterium]